MLAKLTHQNEYLCREFNRIEIAGDGYCDSINNQE